MKSRSNIKRCRPLLGTFVEITIADEDLLESQLHDLAEIAFGRIARVQSLMSFHDSDSELSRLNACGHLHPLPVNEWTLDVIAEAVRLGEASEGVFDITVAPLLVSWGLLPKHQARTSLDNKANFRDIILHDDGRVSFRRPLQLDLGGIAKGFAVDKAAEILTGAGVKHGVINAGGDLRFIGERPPLVSLRDPSTPHLRLIETEVTAPAMATSAAYFANRVHHHRKVNHIVHPHTCKPMRSNISVSVFAPTCVQADALTKIVVLDDPDNWRPLLQKEDASCVFLTARGEKVRFPSVAA